MSIIVKYILKSISEKKFRTFIIVFSVTLSAALFFASSGMSGTMSSMYETQFRMQTGDADLIIFPNKQSPSNNFKLRPEPVDGVTLMAGEVSASGIYRLPIDESQRKTKSENLIIKGFEMDELEQFNPVNFKQYAVGRSFEGNQIILSTLFAEEYGFKVGDRIDIEINGQNRMLTVWGVSRPTGIFQHTPQSDTMAALMPKDTLASIFNIKGRVQTAYVVIEEGSDIQSIKDTISNQYPRYTVQEPFSAEELENYLQLIVVPLFLMTTMVLFISIFIIYSTFKVITVERLPVIGTFRSIGATKRMTDTVLIGESLVYGLLGGVLGNILGIGILYLITSFMSSDPYSGKMDVSVQFNFFHMIMSFLLAVGVALISSWIPIRKVSKIPIKDLVLNTSQSTSSKKTWKTIAGIIMLTLAIILPRIAPKSLALVFNLFGSMVSIVAVIMFVPYITKSFLKFFEKIYGHIFGNEGILAVKNLNDNKNILNNISLLAIGITTLLMINTTSYSVGIEVINAYKDWKFDIMVSIDGADRNVEQVLRSVEGVDGTYGAFEYWQGIKVVDTQYRFGYLQGVDIKKYRDYVAFRIDGDVDPNEAFKQLDEGRNIMVAYMAKEKLDLEIGDSLTLEMTSGNKTYRVIGFYDSIMQNGSNAIISQKYFKTDMEQSFFNSFYIRTSKDPDEVLLSIQDQFMRRGVSGNTIANMVKNNYDANNQFMIILQAFSIIAMLIGIFGIFNNYMISFIERKRSIAILRSVGLSKKQTLKMIMIEALTGGCIGGIVGIIGGTLILSAVPHLMKSINVPISIHYTWSFYSNSLIGGIIIAVLASISPALKTSKLNIIDAIKYE